MPPGLLILSCEMEYQVYYEEEYCKCPIVTHDGIPIFFPKHKFSHAFYESSDRRGANDIFSDVRAQRMSWIKEILQSSTAALYQGWNKKKRAYDPCGRVAFEYEQFVVVVRLSLKKDGTLKGNFITCYQADNSLEKIKQSPLWDKDKCIEKLKEKKR
jgi:hypothetical protein